MNRPETYGRLFPGSISVKTPTKRPNGNSKGKVQRISVSLPESVFCELDQLVAERGWESRSKAISVMVTQSALEHREEKGDTLMAGTITIVYDESKGNLLQRLAELERRFLDEVISSLHVQLENDHRIEVLLVQGPARSLQKDCGPVAGPQRGENRETNSHHDADAATSSSTPSGSRLNHPSVEPAKPKDHEYHIKVQIVRCSVRRRYPWRSDVVLRPQTSSYPAADRHGKRRQRRSDVLQPKSPARSPQSS